MFRAGLERDNLATLFAIPVVDCDLATVASHFKNRDWHSEGKLAHCDKHFTVPDNVFGTFFNVAWQAIWQRNSPVLNTEQGGKSGSTHGNVKREDSVKSLAHNDFTPLVVKA